MLSNSACELEINLKNLSDNYNILKAKALGYQIACVVKANAYGLGVEKISKTLLNNGCKKFFVANLDEAIKLRNFLKDKNIFIGIFHGITQGEESYFKEFNLTPILNSLEQTNIWQRYINQNSLNKKLHIHIDSGMNRLGFAPKDAIKFIDNNLNCVESIMSHYACADEPAHDKNYEQLNIIKKIRNRYKDTTLCLANSSAIFLGEEFYGDILRAGIALYGGNPTPDKKNPMKQIVQLNAPILQIKQIKKGEDVGYGASYRANQEMTLATLPIGYADGYFRSLGNNSYCYFQGVKLPLVGRVSMDLITINISEIKDKIKVGDHIEVIGDNVTICKLAKNAGTIDYEILTNLGNRFKKNYVD